jgi:hypothetical protein
MKLKDKNGIDHTWLNLFLASLVVIAFLIPSQSYAVRIINDSHLTLAVHTYDMNDQTYSFPFKKYNIKEYASLDFPAHDKGNCKLQIWVTVWGALGEKLLRPGQIFGNGQIIIIGADKRVDILPDPYLALLPNRTPNPPSGGNKLNEGEGLMAGQQIAAGGYSLTITNGDLKIFNSEGAVCWQAGASGVEYVIYLSGTLFLYKSNDPQGGYTVVKEFGTFRPNSWLGFWNASGIAGYNRGGYAEWHRWGQCPSEEGHPNCKPGTHWCDCSQSCRTQQGCRKCEQQLTKKVKRNNDGKR